MEPTNHTSLEGVHTWTMPWISGYPNSVDFLYGPCGAYMDSVTAPFKVYVPCLVWTILVHPTCMDHIWYGFTALLRTVRPISGPDYSSYTDHKVHIEKLLAV